MSVSNLHSLFNRPWYIEQNYAQGHLPLIMGILTGNSLDEKDDVRKKPSLISFSHDLKGHNQNDQSVAILDLKNPIVKYDQFCGPQGTKSMMRELDKIKNNPKIAGVVLDIDSGGGQAYGTPEFHDYLREYPKPVVAYTDGLMCSAAYYIGSASSEIIANKRAEHIGSIGAYSQLFDLDGFYEKQGVKVHTMYATKSTEKNKSYREAMKGEEFYGTYIKEELDPLVDTFITDMKSARPDINEAVFKGATYAAPKALEMGLIDELGNMGTAVQKVFELAEEKNPNSTQMSKSYPKIENTIGKTFGDGEAANGILLTELEAEALESVLEGMESVNQQLSDLNQAATDANTENQVFIDECNQELGLEGDNKVTTVSGAIDAYKAKISDLGEQPGATHTGTGDNGTDGEEEHSYMDLDTPFYKKTKELLN